MVFENQAETLSCFPKQFPNMVSEINTMQCSLKFKVTTKGIWNVSEDISLGRTDGQRLRVSVGQSKPSEAKSLVKPSMPMNSGKRRQEMPLDSQKCKKQKMDLSEDKSHEGSVLRRDRVSIVGSEHLEANVLVKPSIPVNSEKLRPEMSLHQRWKKQKLDCNLKLECSKILKELMNHSYGWVFSEPVDPVKLKIPDYFQIIKHPMDLGTIKRKLLGNIYSCVGEFADDVKLTFENAKSYNGPLHKVYHWADILDAIFCKRWKLLEAKLKLSNKYDDGANLVHYTGNNGPVRENNCQVMKPVGLTKAPIHDKVDTSGLISLEKRLKFRPELVQVKPGKKAPDGCLSSDKIAEKGHCNRSALPSSNLIQSVDSTEAKGSLHTIRASHCLSSVAAQTPDSKLDSEFKSTSTSLTNSSSLDLDCPGVVQSEEKSPCSTTPATTSAFFEGCMVDPRTSPRKALRAAMLKSRFADTILKATQPALLDHSNLSKMQQEKRRLEKEQLKEKARIEAEIKAAKAASRKREQDEIKMRRERARMALEKMRQSVEMDNRASLPGGTGTGYPDHSILLQIGLRVRIEAEEDLYI